MEWHLLASVSFEMFKPHFYAALKLNPNWILKSFEIHAICIFYNILYLNYIRNLFMFILDYPL